jgi:hypothetical protein
MADLSLEWKGDFSQTPSGDLVLSEGVDQTRQRVIRRLLTAVRAYIWHQEYGGGLPERIGRVALPQNIEAICRAQIALEQSVAKTPIPVITVTEPTSNLGLFVISISYVDAATGEAVALQFEVPNN